MRQRRLIPYHALIHFLKGAASKRTPLDRGWFIGTPDHTHVSTSICERQNLTMRMSMRRFTRLTNGYSKKLENLEHNAALYFMNYNFCRIHASLRVTPAMEAGIADHVWDLSEVVALIDENSK
jgi:hypothetical protein